MKKTHHRAQNSFASDVPNDALIVENTQTGDVETAVIESFNPVYDTATSTLTYTIMTENGTSIELPSEFGQSVMVIDSEGVSSIHYGGNIFIQTQSLRVTCRKKHLLTWMKYHTKMGDPDLCCHTWLPRKYGESDAIISPGCESPDCKYTLESKITNLKGREAH
jgi:hypothetical protein